MSADLDLILKKYKSGKREELIPLLQEIQEYLGYLSEDAIVRVGSFLGLSTTKIYGLATFYDRFRFTPSGRIHMRICDGTTCFINGSEAVIRAIRENLGIDPGQTTRDGRFSYELTSCMGGCNEGPVVCVGEKCHVHVRADEIPEMITKLKALADLK